MHNMKESGIPWVGRCPEHWNVMANKYVMKKIKYIKSVYEGEDILSLTVNGVVVRDLDGGGKMPTSFDGYQILYPNNLLMCLFDYDVTPRCIGLIKNNGLSSPAYSQFCMKKGYSSRYYYYYYLMIDNTKELLHLAKNLRHSFTEDQLGAICVPVPPIDEQNKIADLLDLKCSEIEELSEAIQKEIDILEEYKKTSIIEAVTKGIDGADLKESGAGWMPFVPSHWKVEKLKYHLKRRTVKNPGNTIVLSLYRELGIVPKDSRDDNHNVTSDDTSKYLYVRKNDFVVNKMKAWQGSVAVSDYEGIVSPAYFVYEFTDDCFSKRYFHYLMRNRSYATEFRRLSGGIRNGQWDLSSQGLENTVVLIPPIEEQQRIESFLDKKIDAIENTIAQKQEQLAMLNNYKQSVIYEYVTGKKIVL